MIFLTWVFSSDISMAFGLTKCGCFIVIRGKIKSTSGITLSEKQIDDIDKRYE